MFMQAVILVLISEFIFSSEKQILLPPISFHKYENYC